jgi:hypothetical protein
MATTIGITTVADPTAGYEGVEVTQVDTGALHEQADGSVVVDHVASRNRYQVRWIGITGAEVTTLEGALTMGTSLELTLPHMAAHEHVVIIPNTYKKSYIEMAGPIEMWRVEVQFTEVA